MIDPSKENLLRGHLHEILQGLSRPQQIHQPGHLADGDLLEEVHFNQLPHQAKNKPFFTLTINEKGKL